MIPKLATAAFLVGGALGVGAMYMTEQRRNARSEPEGARQSSEPKALRAPPREFDATDLDALDNLTLDEFYNRVSHA